MTWEEVRASLETLINDYWASATPIKWENIAFEQPYGTSYAECTILQGETELAGLGSQKLERSSGVLHFNYYVPRNSGTKDGRTKASAVQAHLRYRVHQVLSGGSPVGWVNFRAVSVLNLGIVSDWSQFAVQAPFHFDTSV